MRSQLEASRKLFATRWTFCLTKLWCFVRHFRLSSDISGFCQILYREDDAGHFVWRSRSLSSDIFKIRQTCLTWPTDFAKPAIIIAIFARGTISHDKRCYVVKESYMFLECFFEILHHLSILFSLVVEIIHNTLCILSNQLPVRENGIWFVPLGFWLICFWKLMYGAHWILGLINWYWAVK